MLNTKNTSDKSFKSRISLGRKQILLLGFLMLTAASLIAQTITATLTSSDYNGVNISCFAGQNGTNASGGTPPYTYEWSNDATDATITSLAAGYYAVRVIDSDASTDDVFAEITLAQPEPLQMGEMIPYQYTNGYNVSSYGSCNGSIATNINGCETNQGIGLSEPQRDDWQMKGNYSTNPATQFLGTLDNKDLSFKTNNVERFKIKSNGVADFNFHVNIQTAILFKNNKVITYHHAQNNLPDIMSFGAAPNSTPFSIANCITPQLNTTFQFNGTIQLFGNSAAGGKLNVMEVGFDGYNSIIDATGNSTDLNSSNLLLNYYCGRNVFVGNGTGVDLTANHNLFVYGNTKIDGTVGIGDHLGTPIEKVNSLNKSVNQ